MSHFHGHVKSSNVFTGRNVHPWWYCFKQQMVWNIVSKGFFDIVFFHQQSFFFPSSCHYFFFLSHCVTKRWGSWECLIADTIWMIAMWRFVVGFMNSHKVFVWLTVLLPSKVQWCQCCIGRGLWLYMVYYHVSWSLANVCQLHVSASLVNMNSSFKPVNF